MSEGFRASRIDQHVSSPISHRHAPGLGVGRSWPLSRYQETAIGWRQGEPFELEVRDRAYERQREADAAMVRVPGWPAAAGQALLTLLLALTLIGPLLDSREYRAFRYRRAQRKAGLR